MHSSISHLVQKCVKHDRAAQNTLYQLYCNKMLGVCMWYAATKEEAEEILQDGFIRVFKYLHTYSGEGSLESWIRKVIVNAALAKYRAKKNNLRVVVEIDEEVMSFVQLPDFDSRLAEKELLALVQSLPPAYKMVFNLFVLEGFKHREIAELLGISEGTSKSNLADARAVLQRKINGLRKAAM
ncbi:MAG TPA: RNA polymerase sigma factor [Chitinophagaceae bacterium]|nr:RNA polymerase sigma factor [Chitinophagaceae bacterium]